MGRSPAVSHPDWPLIPADRAFQPWTRASSPSHLRRPRPPSHWRLLCALGFAAAGDSVCRFSRSYFRHSPNCLFGKVHWVGIGGGGGRVCACSPTSGRLRRRASPTRVPPNLGGWSARLRRVLRRKSHPSLLSVAHFRVSCPGPERVGVQ